MMGLNLSIFSHGVFIRAKETYDFRNSFFRFNKAGRLKRYIFKSALDSLTGTKFLGEPSTANQTESKVTGQQAKQTIKLGNINELIFLILMTFG